jgi:hypothetical protein
MSLAGHVARVVEREMRTEFWLDSLKGRDHSQDIRAHVRIFLKWILRKQGANLWTGLVWLRIWIPVNLRIPQNLPVQILSSSPEKANL